MKHLQLLLVLFFVGNFVRASQSEKPVRSRDCYSPASLAYEKSIMDTIEETVPAEQERIRVKDDSNYLYSKEARDALQEEANAMGRLLNSPLSVGLIGVMSILEDKNYLDPMYEATQSACKFLHDLANVSNEENKEKLIRQSIDENKEIRDKNN